MSTIKTLLLIGSTVLAGAAVGADEVVPAWQAPGYVMEEIVVTAKRPAHLAQEPAEKLEQPETADES